MGRIKKAPEKISKITATRKSDIKSKKSVVENVEDFKKLVHLLQVHQIELEHQNEELRITQEELEVSRNKYVNLFDFSPIPYFTLDLNGVIKEVNLSAGKMFAIERSKFTGRMFVNFIQPDERNDFNSFFQTVFSSHIKQSCELNFISKDKRVFHVLLEGLELEDSLEKDKKCQVALIDLTEYKKIEDSLQKTAEELKLINSTKDKFFSIIAHDLKSPFQSLLSYSELLATEIESLSQDEIRSFSSGLNKNLKDIHSLLENLLSWAMMQRDLIVFNPVNLDLCDLTDKIIDISEQNARKKNISISSNIAPQTSVFADADMLYSVIQNLIVNAIKFTNQGGKIIVSSANNESFVEVSVRDTGIGIKGEKIPQLFNFNTLYTTTGTAGEKGTGLGLPLCKEFIERNDGKIWVESELGKGSKFTFTLHKTNY